MNRPNRAACGLHAARLMLLMLLILPLRALATQHPLQWSGFGTVGGLWVDTEALYFNHPSKPGTAPDRPDFSADSVIGLQAMWSLGAHTDLTVQLLSSDDYRNGYRPRVGWAFLRHDLRPDLSLRAGRLAPSFFMLSESVNLNYANPWMRPPVEVYGLNPFTALDGADLIHTRRIGSTDLEVRPYAGQGSMHFPHGRSTLRDALGLSIAASRGNLSLQAGYGSGRIAVHYDDPLFRLIASQMAATAHPLLPSLSGGGIRARFMSFGFRWDDGRWQLIGEYARRHTSRTIPTAHGWHLTAARRSGRFTPFVTLARQSQLRPLFEAQPHILAFDAYRHSRSNAQRSVSVGVRWDVHPQTALKLQWTHVRVGHHAWGAFFPVDETAGTSPAGRSVNMLGLSLDFVF